MAIKRFIVRLRRLYAKALGRRRWNYDPSKHYFRGKNNGS